MKTEIAGKPIHAASLWIGSLVIAFAADLLFYGKTLGVSYLLFVLALYVFFLWQAKSRGSLGQFRSKTGAWLLTVPVLLLASTFVLFSKPLFPLLNVLLVPFLFMLQTLLLTDHLPKRSHPLEWIGGVFGFVCARALPNIRLPFRFAKDWFSANMDRRGIAKKIGTGLLVSLPILIVVIPLLAKADSVFAHLFNELPRRLFELQGVDVIFRMLLIFLFAIGVFAYFYALWNGRKETAEEPKAAEPTEKAVWDGIVLVTVLLVINIVYASFTYIQISYLFTGERAVLPAGMTYAEYARSGFGELVCVALINFAIMLSAMWYASREKQGLYRTVQLLLSLLTVCTCFLLVSAYYRLSLYEAAYGYTYIRFLAHAFMIVLFVMLLVALLSIWRERFPLVKSCLLIGFVAYIAVQYVNMDALIATKNIARYYATGQIDVEYLSRLSYDAVPAIMQLARDEQMRDAVAELLQTKKEELAKQRSWQSFNLSRYWAARHLSP